MQSLGQLVSRNLLGAWLKTFPNCTKIHGQPPDVILNLSTIPFATGKGSFDNLNFFCIFRKTFHL